MFDFFFFFWDKFYRNFIDNFFIYKKIVFHLYNITKEWLGLL